MLINTIFLSASLTSSDGSMLQNVYKCSTLNFNNGMTVIAFCTKRNRTPIILCSLRVHNKQICFRNCNYPDLLYKFDFLLKPISITKQNSSTFEKRTF